MIEGSGILKRTVEKSYKWDCSEHLIRMAFIHAASKICREVDKIQLQANCTTSTKILNRLYKEQYAWEHTITDKLLSLQQMFINNLTRDINEFKEPYVVTCPDNVNGFVFKDIFTEILDSINYLYDHNYITNEFIIRPKITTVEEVKVVLNYL